MSRWNPLPPEDYKKANQWKSKLLRDEKTGAITIKRDRISVGKAFGLNPTNGEGKLKAIKGILLPEVNYGVALTQEPIVIRHQRVWGAMAALKDANGGKMPQLLRRSDVIKVDTGRYVGYWRVKSVKDGKVEPKLDIVRPYAIDEEDKRVGKREVSIKTLMKDGVHVIRCRYTGIALCHTT